MLRINRIGIKLILPLMGAMLAFMAVSYYISDTLLGKRIIEQRTTYFEERTGTYADRLDHAVEMIRSVGTSVSEAGVMFAALAATTDDPSLFETRLTDFLATTVDQTGYVYGYGIWYEPGVIPGREWFGPYGYKDGSSATITWEYSTQEYDYRSQDWYRQATPGRNPKKGFSITAPYYDETSGQTFITITRPMYTKEGNFIGVVSIDWTLDFLPELLADIRMTPSAYPFLLDMENGKVLYHPEKQKINVSLSEVGELTDNRNAELVVFSRDLSTVNYRFGIAVPVSEAYGDIHKIQALWLALLVATLLLISTMILVVSNRVVVKPIAAIARQLTMIADRESDLSARVEVRSGDELGVLSSAFNRFVEKLQNVVNGIDGAVRLIDRDMSTVVSNSDETAASVRQITANIDSVNNAIDRLHGNIEDSVLAVEKAREASRTMKDQVDDQVSAVEQTSSAAEQISAQAVSIRDTAEKRMEGIRTLASLVRESHNDFNGLDVQMRELIKRTEDMMSASSMIDDIAARTNLLAMNAAIEAAHAGERGRGFAVVAAEIRKLAETASQNSRTISSSLNFSAEAVNSLSGIFSRTREIFNRVDDSTKEVSGSFEEIVHTIDELTTGLQEITRSVLSIRDAVDTINEQSLLIHEQTVHVADLDAVNSDIGKSVKDAVREISLGAGEISGSMTELERGIRDLSAQTHEISEQTVQFSSERS